MTFIAIGGAEDKQGDMTVHKAVLAEARGAQSNVVVVTSATAEPEGARDRYLAVYSKLGVTDVSVQHIDTRAKANSAGVISALEKADVVFFTGGDQMRLTQALAGTQAFDTLSRRYQAGEVVLAGTSAGAAAASPLMIFGGDPDKAMQKGEVAMTAGFGFVPGVVFDTHFSERGRLPRLFNAVASHPATVGIGLDEDTAAIVRRDGSMQVVGAGTVTFVDGRGITSCNMADVERGEEFKVDGLRVDKLASGARYDIKTRRPA